MTAAIVQGATNHRSNVALFAISAPPLLRADGVEWKEIIMVRFVRLLAAAALAAAIATAAPTANAQTTPQELGPLDTGPLQTAPLQTAPQKAKRRQTALQKRAKHPAPAGRQITVHARPSS